MIPRYALLFVLLLSLLSLPCLAGGSDEVEWVRNYADGIALAKETGRPVVIDFWADWCGPCLKMDREVWPDDQVVELSKKFVLISIDTDRDEGTARRFQVDSLPTVVFADSWGNVINRHEGYLHVDPLVNIMEAFPKDLSEINKWNAILDKDGKNVEALTQVGQFYAGLGVADLSNRYFKRALKTKEAKSNPSIDEGLRILIGLNQLKMGDNKDARKSFERCLKEYPDGSQCDRAMLGVITALLNQGKLDKAEMWYDELVLKFPGSDSAKQAARNIEMVRAR
ncbi:MAG TPA: thioredoxin family protein [Acidobacteriota bacterium]|nr:thioredoxin family protein [Acidobacteriota bacterium]